MHDQVLRDDRTIGVLLDSLYRLRDSSRVVIVLSADHGVGTIPEVAAESKPGPRRVEVYSLMPAVRARLRAAGVDTNAVELDQQLVVMDRAAFRGKTALADSVLRWFADSARREPGVRRVDRFAALLADSLNDPIARRWSHQLRADAPVELVITLDSLSSWGGNIASHGSSYDYDSRVPIIFYGAGVRPGHYPDFVRTVDIAPTLAALAGVKPTERLDGVVLTRALARSTVPPAP
jgi:arylsulfatase A-like enzyme